MGTVKRHVKAIIQFRRATEPEWIEYNPILRAGEPALSMDIMRVKVGDGVTDWINLDYIDDSSIIFITSTEGLIGEEDKLYINKSNGTAFLWKNNEFVEMESSSIEDLKNRVTTNEQEIEELKQEIIQASDKNYIHNQQSASNCWIIDHNLGKFPSITVVDSAGTVVIGEIVLLTTERAVISFNGAFSGKAYCN